MNYDYLLLQAYHVIVTYALIQTTLALLMDIVSRVYLKIQVLFVIHLGKVDF